MHVESTVSIPGPMYNMTDVLRVQKEPIRNVRQDRRLRVILMTHRSNPPIHTEYRKRKERRRKENERRKKEGKRKEEEKERGEREKRKKERKIKKEEEKG